MPRATPWFESVKRLSWVALAVVALDQGSKLWITSVLRPGQSITVVPGLMNWTLSRNTGMAFGLLNDLHFEHKTLIVTIVSLAALVAVAYFMLSSKEQDRLVHLGLVLVLGGALGNIIDRVRLGYVIDFIDVYVRDYHWHTFNVADSAISVGVGVILLQGLRSPRAALEASEPEPNRAD